MRCIAAASVTPLTASNTVPVGWSIHPASAIVRCAPSPTAATSWYPTCPDVRFIARPLRFRTAIIVGADGVFGHRQGCHTCKDWQVDRSGLNAAVWTRNADGEVLVADPSASHRDSQAVFRAQTPICVRETNPSLFTMCSTRAATVRSVVTAQPPHSGPAERSPPSAHISRARCVGQHWLSFESRQQWPARRSAAFGNPSAAPEPRTPKLSYCPVTCLLPTECQ